MTVIARPCRRASWTATSIKAAPMPAPPQVRFDKQSVEFGFEFIEDHRCKAGNAIAQLGDDDFASFDLPDRELNRIGLGLKLLVIFAERQ